MSKIVLIGGGTAGHVMPNVALLPQLKTMFDEVHYIGTDTGIEKKIISTIPGVIYHCVTSDKLRRSLTLKNLKVPFKVLKGYFESKKILKQIAPDVIFSKGGFASVPAALAASKLKIAIIAHESDLTLGLANKIIYKKCKIMYCSFADTASYGQKCRFSGSAIRPSVLSGNKENAIKKYKLDRTKKTVLIIGGSSGAKRLNDVTFASAKALSERYNLIHITGKGKNNPKIQHTGYIQIEFDPFPEDIFAASDLIVSRAGSNTIFEFLALNKPMLLVPLGKTESRGDQILNAQVFETENIAHVLQDADLNQKTLILEIERLNKNSYSLKENMKKSKLNKLANNEILKTLEAHKQPEKKPHK